MNFLETKEVHTVTTNKLLTTDYDLVTAADLQPGASLILDVGGKMVPVELIKGKV